MEVHGSNTFTDAESLYRQIGQVLLIPLHIKFIHKWLIYKTKINFWERLLNKFKVSVQN